MWPETHSVGGLSFTLYDLARLVAVAGPASLFFVLSRQRHIPLRATLIIAVACIPLCICAARLLNALEYAPKWNAWASAFAENTGSSIYGALFACFLSVVVLARRLKVSALSLLDTAAPAIGLGE